MTSHPNVNTPTTTTTTHRQKEYLHKLQQQKDGGEGGWKDILHKPAGAAEEAAEGGKDTGFTQAQMQEVENIDALVNER